MNWQQYDDLSVMQIAEPVLPVRSGMGGMGLLQRFVDHSMLPVIETDNRLVGMMTDVGFLDDPFRMGAGVWNEEPITLRPTDSVGYARRILLNGRQQPLIPIVDSENRYTGYCASRQALLKLLSRLHRPARIGGMATPLGVYMTSGHLSSGAGTPGLVATGAAFAVLVNTVQTVFVLLFSLSAVWFPPLKELSPFSLAFLEFGFLIFSMLAAMRFSPMAGLHAAEHMTINAIESGLDPTVENVMDQPREHRRCGTNLTILMTSVMSGWLSLQLMRPYLNPLGEYAFALLWILLTVKYWRPIGQWVQTHFTTKPPTRGQLESGLKAGRELLEKYARQPHAEPGILRRIWGMGLLQVLGGFIVVNFCLSHLLETLLAVLAL